MQTARATLDTALAPLPPVKKNVPGTRNRSWVWAGYVPGPGLGVTGDKDGEWSSGLAERSVTLDGCPINTMLLPAATWGSYMCVEIS